MKQQQFDYGFIMELGFKEKFFSDDVFYKIHGFPYSTITKKLNKKIFLDYCKSTRTCELIRVDSFKKGNVKKRMAIRDKDHLLEIIDFFTNK